MCFGSLVGPESSSMMDPPAALDDASSSSVILRSRLNLVGDGDSLELERESRRSGEVDRCAVVVVVAVVPGLVGEGLCVFKESCAEVVALGVVVVAVVVVVWKTMVSLAGEGEAEAGAGCDGTRKRS